MRILPEDRLVLDALKAREAQIVGRAVDWCAINSGSRHIAGLEKQKLILAEFLDDLPGRLEHRALQASPEVADDGALRHQPHTDALLMTVRPDAPVQVVLTGHYDTVFPAESVFQKLVVREDGALNGPGIADMKGGISVMLAALEEFERHPLRERVGYRVLLSPDEEIGSLGSGAVLAEIGRLGHVGLTYEPALSDGTLAGARKGSGNFHLVVKGKAAHAGRDFALGRNAIAAAAELACRLHALNGVREGVTVNVAKISGGAPLNVVADNAVVRFNVRVPDAEGAAWIDRAIDEVCAVAPFEGISIHRHGGFTRPAKPFDASQQALFGAVKAVGDLLGQPIGWKPSGGVCEGNNLYAVGLPNVDTLGVRGGDIHSEAEYAWPQSFVERAQLSALILMKLASGEIDAAGIRALRDAGPRVALAEETE
ncbi:hydrolase [Caulobacter sp. 17J80-11]|uniref:hydrolase n=1 Tax=Caulobacter sp. 17J80-11 TaxID=2763502 RepID=UPI0016539B87|nr:hydrolase [Caulobacter sp. 17J80-11]MBC6981241.1 hydrolase [Caulobacter sp. 17J80-11]